MEGQGVAASSASAVGRQGQYGPAETHVTSDITRGGEGRGRNGDDSHVMMGSGHPEASSQDDGMPQTPDSSQPPPLDSSQPPPPGGQARPPAGGQASQEPAGRSAQEPEGQSPQGSQAEFSSQQIKSDKADNIGDPDRNNSVVARDENTGHNKTTAGLVPSAVDAPAANSPAADDSGEPKTVQFAAIPLRTPRPQRPASRRRFSSRPSRPRTRKRCPSPRKRS
jgi:hypothetical protein